MRQPFFLTFQQAILLGSALFGNDFPKQTRQKPLHVNSDQFFSANQHLSLSFSQSFEHQTNAMFYWHSGCLVAVHGAMRLTACGEGAF